MKRQIHLEDLDMADPNESNTVLLSNPPSLKCKKYSCIKAHGNHWRVEDNYSRSLLTYDSGVACFKVNEHSNGSGQDYIGVLEDIILMDYGDLKTLVLLFSCQ